jgi:hypothetical protein
VIHSSETNGEPLPVTAARHPLVDGLVFEDALCRPPGTPLPGFGEPLLLAGRHPVAVLDAVRNRVIVADTLLDENASVVRRTGYAVFWSRVLHRLARWDDAPLALSPAQARLPDFDGYDKLVLIGSVERGEGTVTKSPAEGSLQIPLWQWILVGALALVLLEATLGIRGRIA